MRNLKPSLCSEVSASESKTRGPASVWLRSVLCGHKNLQQTVTREPDFATISRAAKCRLRRPRSREVEENFVYMYYQTSVARVEQNALYVEFAFVIYGSRLSVQVSTVGFGACTGKLAVLALQKILRTVLPHIF